MLEVNTSLRELILSRNNIGDKGTESIAAALQRNTTLTSLALDKIYLDL
jgi:Ran GTPase-activating protein (RanGAP) involved in mRNA processing and transport